MKTKSILLLVLIASAMIKVFVYFCICVFVSVLILAMIQDQALVSSKHFLVETEDNNLADNVKGYIPKPRVGYGPKYTGGTDLFNVIGFSAPNNMSIVQRVKINPKNQSHLENLAVEV